MFSFNYDISISNCVKLVDCLYLKSCTSEQKNDATQCQGVDDRSQLVLAFV